MLLATACHLYTLVILVKVSIVSTHHIHDLTGSMKHPLGQHTDTYISILPRKKLRVQEKS